MKSDSEFSALAACPSNSREEALAPIRKALVEARSVLSIAHPFSDGDSLGSQLAMHLFCKSQGKRSVCLNFDPIPQPLLWLKGTNELVSSIDSNELFDVVFLMETTDAARMGDRVSYFKKAKKRIHLDHHFGVKELGDLSYIDPTASSTCEILYDLLFPLRHLLSREVLEALYVGIMTDTGNFRFSNTTPRAHQIAGEIVASGVDIAKIFKLVYETNPFNKIVIHGLTMSRAKLVHGGKTVYSFLNWKDFTDIGAGPVDADGAINQLCTIAGVEVALVFREQDDGEIKVSMRSNGKVDVQTVSKSFGGGGHKQAAGASLKLPLRQAIEKVLDVFGSVVPQL